MNVYSTRNDFFSRGTGNEGRARQSARLRSIVNRLQQSGVKRQVGLGSPSCIHDQRNNDERATACKLGFDSPVITQSFDRPRLGNSIAIGARHFGPGNRRAGGIGQSLLDRLTHGRTARKIGDDDAIAATPAVNNGAISRHVSPSFCQERILDTKPVLDGGDAEIECALALGAFGDLLAKLADFRAGCHRAVDFVELDIDVAAELTRLLGFIHLLLCRGLQEIEIRPSADPGLQFRKLNAHRRQLGDDDSTDLFFFNLHAGKPGIESARAISTRHAALQQEAKQRGGYLGQMKEKKFAAKTRLGARDFDPDEPRDESGKWAGGGEGGKKADVKARIGDFVHSNGDAIGQAARKTLGSVKSHQRELIAGAITAALYHGVGLDFPAEVESAIHGQIINLAENLKVTNAMAHKVMSDAVTRLKSLRGIKDTIDADRAGVDAALVKLGKVLAKLEPRYRAQDYDPEQPRDPHGRDGVSVPGNTSGDGRDS
jgi:hypothetical protein